MVALAFAAIGAGAVALIAGVRGSSLASVLQGKPDHSRLGPAVTGPEVSGGAGQSSPAGGGSPRWFAQQLLNRLGIVPSNGAVAKLEAWETQEGGNWHNAAHFNPLNTTLQMPGATAGAGEGVKAYANWGEGIEATARTLSHYPQIVAAIRGGSLQGFKSTVNASAWGTRF